MHAPYNILQRGVGGYFFTCEKTCVLLSSSGSTVEPLNKGHLGTQAAVPYSEVVPYWEVCIKLCFYSVIYVFGALK